jgi:hypothetical protein
VKCTVLLKHVKELRTQEDPNGAREAAVRKAKYTKRKADAVKKQKAKATQQGNVTDSDADLN